MQSLDEHPVTITACAEATQPCSPPQQDPRSSQITRNNMDKSGVKWAARVALRPFRATRQAWNDYQNGRMMRKREGQAESYGCGSSPRCKAQSGADTRRGLDQSQQGAAEASEPRKGCKSRYFPRNEGDNRPHHLTRGWEHQGGEFPWRIERSIQEEENWRGVWVLEVKDMWSMDWGRLRTVSQAHWPFPYEREPDELLKREPDELRDWLEQP